MESQRSAKGSQPISTPLPMAPDHAFCCKAGPIPLSFSHLLTLIPPATTYIPLTSSHAANSLFTSFLTAQTLSLVYSPSTPLSDIPSFSEEFSMQSFKAIIQITKLAVPPPTQESMGFTTSPVFSRQSTSSSSTASPPATKPEVHYYVPFGDYGRDKFIEGKREILVTQKWKRIPLWDADESLRPPDSQIKIGDGEVWIELAGVERLCCARHEVWWEMKAWVRI